jgi:hypothetical protein
MSRFSLVVALLALLASSGCLGSSFQGDCSGGTYNGERCVPDPGVHWTDAKATAEALAYDAYNEAPGGKGRLTEAQCRVVARFRFYEAESVCTAVFVAPDVASRKVVVAFSLSGHGIATPDCRQHWKSNPYCSGHDDAPYERAEQRAAIQVAQMPVPPFNERPLTDVTCHVSGERATCDGTRDDGERVTVRFTVGTDGSLTALCVSPQHPNPPPNIFCAL